jgi:putative transposase
MSRKGNCWKNAVSESFFHTLKTELMHHQTYQTQADANKPCLNILRSFTTASDSIPLMVICHLLTLN